MCGYECDIIDFDKNFVLCLRKCRFYVYCMDRETYRTWAMILNISHNNFSKM